VWRINSRSSFEIVPWPYIPECLKMREKAACARREVAAFEHYGPDGAANGGLSERA